MSHIATLQALKQGKLVGMMTVKLSTFFDQWSMKDHTQG